ncbi:MAG: ArsC/Spx/MgsR family protein [Bacteroidota bacterium]
MNKKVYHLSTCKTNQKILADFDTTGFEMQEIKSTPLTEEQVDEMAKLAGSYEAVFSRRAMKFRQWGLDKMDLTEADYRKYLLEDYTFLKRPVFVIGDQVFAGSAKKAVEGAKETALAG